MRLLSGYVPKSIVVSDGLKIYYEISSPEVTNEKNIVFIHGLGGDVTSWDQERIAFRNLGYTTIALDLRGHGLSQRAKTEKLYSMDSFIRDVLEVITYENLTNVAIVGHCFGGLVALTLEALYPKTAYALTLVDTTYKPASTSSLITDHRLLNKIFMLLGAYAPEIGLKQHVDATKFIGTHDISIIRFLSDVVHTSLRSYFLIYHNFVSFDATTLLDRITVPTLIIEGTNDSIFPPTVAKALYKRIKSSELEMIKDANHIIVINNPSELVKTIYHFLQRVEKKRERAK